ncbi:MAG: lycopene beta-cyclase CrtY [Pseudomonadota bacterium]
MKTDIAIVGGGLSGGLIALKLLEKRRDISILLIERSSHLGGNHTWSFHHSDLPPQLMQFVKPMIASSWSRQQVRFPAFQRTLNTGYASMTSEQLHKRLEPLLGENVIFNADVYAVEPNAVVLSDGRRIEAGAVIDARGQRNADALTIGFQKFLGQEIRFAKPHGLTAPIIMDANIPQSDGYRFIYVLPFSEDTALVEDTYYADGSDLETETTRAEIASYCERAGWPIAEILREENGVLPIALAGDIKAHLDSATPGVSLAGLGAGLFHPLTGYSLPDAARLAERVANAHDLSGPALYNLTRSYAEKRWRERGFYRLLSRFLYYAARPSERHLVLGRFYRLSGELIERFYASESSRADKMRVLVGKPPVNFLKAVECMDEDRWLSHCWKPRLVANAA